MKKNVLIALSIAGSLLVTILAGCEARSIDHNVKEWEDENVIITETGQVLKKTADNEATAMPTETPVPLTEKLQNRSPVTIQAGDTEIDVPQPQQAGEDQKEPVSSGDGLQLVFLGDSIFDNNRDGTGIPYLTAMQCDAKCINLAIGGTSATLEYGEQAENELWTSRSLQGIVKVMGGYVSADLFAGTRAGEQLANPENDFSQTDYFIIEYGLNDFFRGMPLSTEGGLNRFTYVGALRCAIAELRGIAPDATIIICSPHYIQLYHDGFMVGDGNITNTGYGTLYDYKGISQYVAGESNSLFLNAYDDLDINTYTAEEYLEDGVHFTEAGRQLYADALTNMILKYEETKNN